MLICVTIVCENDYFKERPFRIFAVKKFVFVMVVNVKISLKVSQLFDPFQED